jgi:hypothetical protein
MTLLPGDPGVFKALADKKANAPPCWIPDAFHGIEVASEIDSYINRLGMAVQAETRVCKHGITAPYALSF